MSNGDMVLVPVLVGIVMALIEVVKMSLKKRKESMESDVIESDRRKLDDIHRIVTQTDNEGRPLVYTPIDLVRAQIDLVDSLRDLSKAQKELDWSIRLIRENLDGKGKQ